MEKRRIPALTLGLRMMLARETVDITSMEMARKLKVSRHSVTGWERGRHMPSHSTLVQWAEITNTDTAWLIEGRLSDMSVSTPAKTRTDDQSREELARMFVDLLLKGTQPPGYTPERVMSNFEIDLRSEEPEIVYAPELADLKAG